MSGGEALEQREREGADLGWWDGRDAPGSAAASAVQLGGDVHLPCNPPVLPRTEVSPRVPCALPSHRLGIRSHSPACLLLRRLSWVNWQSSLFLLLPCCSPLQPSSSSAPWKELSADLERLVLCGRRRGGHFSLLYCSRIAASRTSETSSHSTPPPAQIREFISRSRTSARS